MNAGQSIKKYVEAIGKKARAASAILATTPTGTKRKAILEMAKAIEGEARTLIDANKRDLRSAEKRGISAAVRQRLALTEKTIAEICSGLRQVASLTDPVGEVISKWKRPNGLAIQKVRVPIGVIAMIYEARPSVTADAAALCIMAGNAVILRGGKRRCIRTWRSPVP